MEQLKEATEKKGYYGQFGGRYIPETLMNELNHIEATYNELKDDPEFQEELHTLLRDYANRPSLLYFAKNMTEDLGGAQIYLKREDLNHTGAHKINNVLGQALLAKHMGKTRFIAETGAGQHGVATATVAALMGMECEIFMGKEDTERQKLNVYRMELLGAKVHAVTSGSMVLKDAVNATMQEWVSRVDDTFYILGSTVGPYPFPKLVHDFQSVISQETKRQLAEQAHQLPDMVVACVGGGSNAIGSFANFIDDESVKLVGVEAAGKGVNTDQHAATLEKGSTGIFHGMKSMFLQNHDGQIDQVYSISAGLDYPGIGPEHADLQDRGRAQYVGITDDEAVSAFEYIAQQEGIVAAIESCHALAYVRKIAPTMAKDKIIVCTVSGRGDKDVAAIAKYRGVEIDD
ncbi:tryptophan synthase beta subunit [Secundilactobacillus oryzae JCM 18671]|uniref:Tryptophan synthase beta chain n=1 Tax=Secundilactobacillus oryzae JCM 18671 TaxID=1291743 RepID=A0A081BGD4_9LACO|nr:tryptophan synthase subunit beta [Secundilactobacillus oryzae]GAK47102.1 tryptophan synthase beta subunit [Secundilactobacillus oryzae JCM 18671]